MNEFDINDQNDIDNQINLGHLLFTDRKCRVCGDIKNLLSSFYRTRKDRGSVSSSYSYECKECCIKRIQKKRTNIKKNIFWEYPDW
jgi:hypothetical protein